MLCEKIRLVVAFSYAQVLFIYEQGKNEKTPSRIFFWEGVCKGKQVLKITFC